MKLLFDANISRALVDRLADEFPGSTHVSLVALEKASDREVWEFAAERDFVIVSKDEDFPSNGFPERAAAEGRLGSFGKLLHRRHRAISARFDRADQVVPRKRIRRVPHTRSNHLSPQGMASQSQTFVEHYGRYSNRSDLHKQTRKTVQMDILGLARAYRCELEALRGLRNHF